MPNDQQEISSCIQKLQKSKNYSEKKEALETLQAMGQKATPALKILLELIRKKEDFSLRSNAEEVIIGIGTEAIEPVLKLTKAFSWRKRARGLSLLANIALQHPKAANKAIFEIANLVKRDPNYRVRLDAVDYLKQIGLKYQEKLEPVIVLGKTLRKDRNNLVQKATAEALAEIQSHQAINELVKSLLVSNYKIVRFSAPNRYEAANGILNISQQQPEKLKEVVSDLFYVLENDPHPATRIIVILPILLVEGWDAVERVLGIATTAKFYHVRLSAIDNISILFSNPSKKDVEPIIPILRIVEREDKSELVQASARRLLEMYEKLE